ncbi:MAG TPA: MBL fold metallo-hydrolase [Spirochaetia bacterium]|nr:MBL fold metallo-hydrolase [Spirochaetia bacterium]
MLHFSYHSTRCFFLKSSKGNGYLAIDAGWPCTLYEYARNLKSLGFRLDDIRWAFVTHYHMDHAGLTGEFLDHGITCFIFENQADAIDSMERTIQKNYGAYRTIDRTKLVSVKTQGSRSLLEGLGVDGEVIVTDYHSPDSVSFVSTEGESVVGDLPPEAQGMPDDRRLHDCWDLLRGLGARRVFPSHGPWFEL